MDKRSIAWLAGMLLAAGTPAAAEKLKLGKPAPDIEMVPVDGDRVRLADLRGQVVVLNLWATWCVPCRTELPLLDGYYRLAAKYGLRMFAITTADSAPVSRLRPLFKAMTITPIKAVHGTALPYTAVPMNYVVDRAGIVRYAKAGAFDLDELNAVLIPLLREPPPGS